MRTLYKFLRAGVVSALFVQVGFAQKENVGIGTTKPDQSAILDLSSTNKGLLMPRVSLQQRNSIQNPANGLIVYQTDMLSGFYYYDGKEWKSVGAETAQKSVADAFNWGLTGNAGTNAATNFIGTTDNVPLVFKVNNFQSGRIDPTKFAVFLGYRSGNSTYTDLENVGIGSETLPNLTSGFQNVAVGSRALFTNTTGKFNMAIGSQSLFSNTSGEGNTSIGVSAMYGNTTGGYNTAIGANSLGGSTTSYGNTAVGAGALATNSTGIYNVAIGHQAGLNETGSNKLYVANSNTATPLIYGSFSAEFLAVGGVDAAAAKRDNLASSYGLLVKKGILTEKIKVATMSSSDWADYVFEKDYKVMPLEQVEAFIKENKHLPNVPTTAEMMSNGNDLIKTDAKLLEKIEELTLYIIELNKKIKELENNKK